MEVWEKVLVDAEWIETDVHAKPGCISCHGGVAGTLDKEEAHEGLVAKASADAQQACGSCHIGIVAEARDSLHRMQWGYHEVLQNRGADFTVPETVTAYTTHCTSCHADCGDCHISRPSALEGGLIYGHDVRRIANVNLTCGGCHGARVNDEYKGRHEGIPADTHWEQQGMPCIECHNNVDDYHAGTHGTRYDGAPDPSCTQAGCHEDVKPGDGVLQHQLHWNRIQCQVCHAAGAYKSCYNCHTGRDDDDVPYFTTEPSEMTFKIGLNPLQSEDRPWEYVLLRHAPSNPDLFAYYGEDLLPEFDQVPTWKYATPHNMRRNTPQNETCNSCHGNTELFLSEVDVPDGLLEANRSVIVTEIPAPRKEVIE